MCKEYNSFDELPQELKEKFKYKGKSGFVRLSKEGYVSFINELNKRGDILIGDYIKNDVKTLVLFNCGHEWEITPSNYKNGRNCGHEDCCIPKRVETFRKTKVETVGCLADTYPELMPYLMNKEDGYKYTPGNGTKIDVKCIECGYEKKIRIKDLVRQGFGCQQCGKGVSYPERVVNLVLSQLNKDFKVQYKFDTYKYKYDVIVDDNIIEIHGIQHYKFKEQLDNDMIKYDIAVLHGYEFNKNYFIIDASHSTIEWMRDSILKCKFFNSFNLTDIDWETIDKEASKSLRVEVCKYWANHKPYEPDLSSSIINEIFHTTQAHIWLSWGSKIGLCDYDGKDELQKMHSRRSYFVYLINDKGDKWFEECMSMSQLEKHTGISIPAIKKSCEKMIPLSEINSLFDDKYIGSFAVYANEWDTNKDEVWHKLQDKKPIISKKYYLINHNGEKWINKPMIGAELGKTFGLGDATIRKCNKIGKPLTGINAKYDSKYIGSYVVDAEEWDKLHDNKEA